MNQRTIGSQIWTTENLNVDRFRNGDLILEAKSPHDWMVAAKNESPAWCYYNYDSTYATIFGKIYNGYAIVDHRILAPKDWHIPDDNEWVDLINFNGGKEAAAYNLKIDIVNCESLGFISEWAGSNESGFSALPGSYCCYNGNFFSDFNHFPDTSWWSSTKRTSQNGKFYFWTPIAGLGDFFGGSVAGDLDCGSYVRLIKD